MQINQPVISIIIPVYNVEQWIGRCLDSILKQDYTNFTVIVVVDGGSIDSTSKICDEYTQKDLRINVFHTTNRGVSSVRNFGLRKVQTTWFTFIDADDYVRPHYLSNLISPVLSEKNIDLIQCSHIVKTKNKEVVQRCVNTSQCTGNMDDILRIIRGFVWGKLFKTDVVKRNGILFDPSISLAEDLCFVLCYLQYVNIVSFNEQADYIYVMRETSATKKRHKPEVLYKQFHIEFKLIEQLEKRIPQNSLSVIYRKELLASSLMNYIVSLYINPSLIMKKNKIKEIPEQELDILIHFSSSFRVKKWISNLLYKRQWRLSSILLSFIYGLKRLYK